MKSWRWFVAYPVILIANFCVLLLEITAGRLLAPAVGGSLETWTGTIAVVLSGFALGDALGGRLADRYPSPRLLSALLLTSAAAVYLTADIAAATRELLLTAPLFVRVLVVAAIVYLLPSMFLGAVAPVVVRLTMSTIEHSGTTVGGLGALATLGNLLGAILGAFVILENWGLTTILMGAGLTLALLALAPLLVRVGLLPRDELAPQVENPNTRVLLLLLPAVGGVGVMAVELATARLLAPIFGSSLYTWGSVIGTVLLGIAIGNMFGGRLADRHLSSSLLSRVLILAGGVSLTIPVIAYAYTHQLAPVVHAILSRMPPALGLPFLYGALLLVPSLLFGMVSPIAIRSQIHAIGSSGRLVGQVYASQAIGSIAGTVVTGFVLISAVGARMVILLVGVTTMLIGVYIGSERRPVQLILRCVAVGGFMILVLASIIGQIPSGCLRESNYYCIRVRTQEGTLRALVLDQLIHSYVDLADRSRLFYLYEHAYARVLADIIDRKGRGIRTLTIGGGGYTFPQYIHYLYPKSTVDVVEIDPAVTQVAHAQLGLPRTTPITSYNMDGRAFFFRYPGRKYDAIFSDAFGDAYSVPSHLMTLEFAQVVAASLQRNGIYAVNVIDGARGQLLRSYILTLQSAFRYVYLLPVGRSWQHAVQAPFVVIATQQALDMQAVMERAVPGVPVDSPLITVSDADLAAYLANGPSVVLTDDYAPVDNFLRRLYADAVRRRR